MSEGDRSQFYKEAEHLKSLHRLQHPDYKFSPKTVRNVSIALTSMIPCLLYLFPDHYSPLPTPRLWQDTAKVSTPCVT